MAKSARSLGTVGFVSGCAFAQLLLQFVLQVVLARYFGAGPQMDAYLAAFAVPVVLTAILVGSLSYAFVPVFIERVRNAGEDAGWEMATVVGASVAALAAAIALIGYTFAFPLVSRLYPGFSMPQTNLTAGLFRVVIWLMVTNSLVSFLFSVYHGIQRFTVPALSSVIGTALTVGLTVYWQRSLGIYAVAWAVLCGSVLQTMILLPSWLGSLHFRGRIDEGTRRCLTLLLPLIAGAAYYKLDPLVDRYLASPDPGSISHLGYAWRIATALITIGTTGLSTVAFPALSMHSAGGRMEAFRDEIAHCWRLLAFLMIPICIGLALFSRPAVADLLERGAFTSADTAAVAWLLVLYIGAIIAASAGEVAAKVFYSLNNTRTPTVIIAVSFTLGLGLKIALTPLLGATGLALATSVYMLVSAGWMFLLIGRLLGRGCFGGLGAASLRAFAGSAGAATAAWSVLRFEFFLNAIAAAVAGLIAYLALMWLLGDEFARRRSRPSDPRAASPSQ